METTDILVSILERAQQGDFIEFKYITSWHEFRFRSKQHTATKIVIKTLKSAGKRLFKAYCDEVIAGVSDINKLIAYTQLLEAINFYQADLVTLKKMVDEYDSYLGDWGNFFNAIFGGEREL